MSGELVVNGVTYVPLQQCGEIKIAVLDRGFVYVGRCKIIDGVLTITNARSVIRWGTSTHLGELIAGPKENTKLGDPCTVTAFINQLIHTIEVKQDVWANHID